ncbi:MAG: RsmG family class I SAM-dependent methyltransferase, partial [Pseudomonadota bacterium]|nr:RsmG family class I SAM-dependent methyltransferase [Pseudomonadota bacterium]
AELHLVEADQKKAVFLQTVIRETGIRATIHNKRVESLPAMQADIVTARALASLDRLLDLLDAQLVPGTRCLFLKGARAEAELAALDARRDIACRLHPSLTNPDAFVVDLTVTSYKGSAARHVAIQAHYRRCQSEGWRRENHHLDQPRDRAGGLWPLRAAD